MCKVKQAIYAVVIMLAEILIEQYRLAVNINGPVNDSGVCPMFMVVAAVSVGMIGDMNVAEQAMFADDTPTDRSQGRPEEYCDQSKCHQFRRFWHGT